jgi:phosphoglycerate dehydrogenase-like enzyme
MIHLAFLDAVDPRIRAEIDRLVPRQWRLSGTRSNASIDRQSAAADATVAMIIGTGIDESLLKAAPRLRFVQKLGAGVDNVDLAACQSHRVAIARLQAGNAVQVAEHTLMLMLAALRRLTYFDRHTRKGAWLRAEGRAAQRQLAGKRVGIIGLGAIGRQVARRLKGFDVEVVYYDIRRPDAAVEAELQVRFLPFGELLASSDVVSLHTPLDSTTRNMLSAENISRLNPGATIINCARGGLIDEAALHWALESGRIYAAGLDTFDVEPLNGSPLLHRDDTVVTPHLAGATFENFINVFERGLANIHRFLARQPLPEGELVLSGEGPVDC